MKLREIVANYLDSADQSSHSFRRLWNLGKFGVQTEFSLDVFGTIKTALIPVSANKSAMLPDDCVRYFKLGIANNNGELSVFKRNDKLTTYHSEYFANTNRLEAIPTLPSWGINGGLNGYGYNDLLFLNYWYGTTSYNLFGLGSGTCDIGQYTIDEAKRIIQFDPYFQWDSFLCEYLSDDCDSDGDYEIDIRMAEAVKAYIRWQDVADRPKKASPSAVRELRSQYYNAKRLARTRLNPIVLNEMQNIERRSWKLVAKA
jgi:hypothetical protein